MNEQTTETNGNINLAEAKRHAEYFTGKLSENARQLSFAGIGSVWVFSGGTAASLTVLHIPTTFLVAGLAFVTALAFDFLQYVCGGAAWSWFRRKMELEITENNQPDSFLAPRQINWELMHSSG
jgi:hypothetical protein